MTGDADKPLILFDGDCNLCNGFVQFVIRRVPRARFRFAALRSAAAQAALTAAGVDEELPDSIVLLQDGHVRTRSAAALATEAALVLRPLSAAAVPRQCHPAPTLLKLLPAVPVAARQAAVRSEHARSRNAAMRCTRHLSTQR